MTTINDTIALSIQNPHFNQEDRNSTCKPDGNVASAPSSLQAATMLNELVYKLLLRENISAANLSAEDAADILVSQFLVAADGMTQMLDVLITGGMRARQL